MVPMRWLFLLAGTLVAQQGLWAADREQREYVVHVNGSEAGKTTIDIHVRDDGQTDVGIRAQVKLQQFLILNYTWAMDGTESWRDGKLVCATCQATENGKTTEVAITSAGGQLRARVNGAERALSPEIWTSTFWKLPDARYHNKQLGVFEIDTGKDHQGQLLFVGKEQLTMLNRLQECYHFRYTGGASPTDLWFDPYYRLVRQEFVESGQRTIVQLVGIRRP